MFSSPSLLTISSYSIDLVEKTSQACKDMDRSSMQMATKDYNSKINQTCLGYIA